MEEEEEEYREEDKRLARFEAEERETHNINSLLMIEIMRKNPQSWKNLNVLATAYFRNL